MTIEQPADSKLDASANPDQRYLNLRYEEITVGPLPGPALLGQYEQVIPGLAQQIVDMAVREQRHRHEIERREVRQPYQLAINGQYLGFGVTILVLVVAVVFTALGFPAIAATLVGLDLVALVGLFIYGRRVQPTYADGEDAPESTS